MDKQCACDNPDGCVRMPITMRAGETLGGKYVLDQLLGKGGMGAVWAAYDVQTQQKVAVKVILPQLEEELTKELRQRLLREARACAKLQHPNIIQVFEVGETDHGNTFMILELLDGQPLGDVLKQKRRLEPKVAARIAAEIASGLSEAHAAKVIHRDLKPANIFLHREPGMAEDEFVTKVLDFGVCIDREAMDTLKTRVGIIVGSPAYMSPEQVAMRKDIDGRTDIWSLGLILYEMVTGMRVFTGNVQNVMAQIITQQVPAPSSKVRDVPPDLDAVVARCTQVKKELRYAEAAELARDLYVIAGVRAPVRQPSTSRSSIRAPSSKQALPGLLESYEADILATPAVSQGGEPMFNPQGLTLPMVPAERRAEVEKMPLEMPPVVDEEGLAATLPLQSNPMAMLRPKPLEEAPVVPEIQGAHGTQFIQMNAPIASPAPAWKQEMERALEVHRQSSHSLPVVDAEVQAKLAEISQSVEAMPSVDAGGTQMLPGGTQMVRLDAPLPPDADGTTSVVTSMSQEVRPQSRPPDAAIVTGRRKRNTNQVFYGAAGFLAAAVVLLVGVMVIREKAKQPKTTPEVASSVTLPLPPMTIDSASPEESTSVPVEAPQLPPSASAAPVDTAPVVPSASAMTSASAPPGTGRPLPPNPYDSAGSTAVVPGKTAAPVNKSSGTGKSTKKPPESPKEKCTGVGVFKRCVKVP